MGDFGFAKRRVRLRLTIFVLAFWSFGPLSPAGAHDVWADGELVPEWVKKACCGPDDVHRLTPDQVRLTPQGWRVEGYPDPIPVGKELPAPDGGYWIFYRRYDDGSVSPVYCFFTPQRGA